jgi:hypothetical protein
MDSNKPTQWGVTKHQIRRVALRRSGVAGGGAEEFKVVDPQRMKPIEIAPRWAIQAGLVES